MGLARVGSRDLHDYVNVVMGTETRAGREETGFDAGLWGNITCRRGT
jgi:hypothetical protein